MTETDMFLLGADLLARLRVGVLEVAPLVGVGWARYHYAWEGRSGGDLAFVVGSGSATRGSLALHLGASAAVSVHGLRLDAEYSLYSPLRDTTGGTPDRTRAVSLALAVAIGG